MPIDLELTKFTSDLRFTSNLHQYINDLDTGEDGNIWTFCRKRKEPLVLLDQKLEVIQNDSVPKLDMKRMPMVIHIEKENIYVGYNGRGSDIPRVTSMREVLPGFIQVYNRFEKTNKLVPNSDGLKPLKIETADQGIYVMHNFKGLQRLTYLSDGNDKLGVINSRVADITTYNGTLYALHTKQPRNLEQEVIRINKGKTEDVCLEVGLKEEYLRKFAIDDHGNILLPMKSDSSNGRQIVINAYSQDGKYIGDGKLTLTALHCFHFDPKFGLLAAGPTKLGYELHCYKINYT